jgi:hypothetical protein
MTTPTGIDRTAPVIAHHEIDINAPLETVWAAAHQRQQLARLADRHHRGAPGRRAVRAG